MASRSSMQWELMELQRRVAEVEARLGMAGVTARTAGPVVEDAGTIAEHLVLVRELSSLRRRVELIEERLGRPLPVAVVTADGEGVVRERAARPEGGAVATGGEVISTPPLSAPVAASVPVTQAAAPQVKTAAAPVIPELEVLRPAPGRVAATSNGVTRAEAGAAKAVEQEKVRGEQGRIMNVLRSAAMPERRGTLTVAGTVPPAAAFKPVTFTAEGVVEEGAKEPVKRKAEPFNLEKVIAGKWLPWIGALAVVIAIGMLMKYGYDHQWFVVPPVVRCLMGAGFGVALIVVGELVRKRLNVVAAAGLLAAGVGTVYASAFAAYRLYGLLPEAPGMVLLAVSAALGIAVGVRSKLVSVTVLSLVGGYAAPFIIPGASAPAVLPVFLLMLLGVGLTISAVMGGKFTVLRALVWWATLLIGGGWVVNVGMPHAALSLTFIVLTWAAVHAELLLAAKKNALLAPADEGRRASGFTTWRPVMSTFSTTAWSVVLAVNVLDRAGIADWLAPAGFMAVAAMLWVGLAGGLRTLREEPRTDMERLGAAFFTQAAGLLIVTIALALSGWGEVLAWSILALTAFGAARWMRARALDVYAIITLLLTSGRMLFVESWMTGMTSGAVSTPLGFVLSTWTGVMVMVGATWVAASFIVRRDSARWVVVTNAMMGVGMVMAACGFISIQMHSYSLPLLAGTAAVATVVAARLRKSNGLAILAGSLQVGAFALLLPTRWWDVVTPGGVNILGLHLEPVALCLPYVALTAIGVLLMSPREGRAWKNSFEIGIAATVTFLGAALMHVQSPAHALAVVVITGALVITGFGAKRRSAGLVGYAGLMLLVGTVMVLSRAWWVNEPVAKMLGLVVTMPALVAVFAAGAWAVVSLAMLRLEGMTTNVLQARGAMAGAIVLAMASVLHVQADVGSVCLVWMGIAFVLGLLRNVRRELALDFFNVAALAPATVVWVVAYVGRWSESGAAYVLHPGLWLALLLAGAWLVSLNWYRGMSGQRAEAVKAVRSVATLVVFGLVFASTSLEVARIAAGVTLDQTVRGAAISIWWGLLAIGLVAVGLWRRNPAARWTGLGLIAVAMFKAVFVDLVDVPQLWRIASFIGLGLMMLAVPVAYSRMSGLLGGTEEGAKHGDTEREWIGE